MLYTLCFFLSSKCSLFHNANLFGFCIIHILYTGCAKLKKNNSGAKGLIRLGGCVTQVQDTTKAYELWFSRIDTRKAKLSHVHAIKEHLEVDM